MSSVVSQQYRISSSYTGLGHYVFADEKSDDIIGFVSKVFHDSAIEVTLFVPSELGSLEGILWYNPNPVNWLEVLGEIFEQDEEVKEMWLSEMGSSDEWEDS
jgi:hypothetical protein